MFVASTNNAGPVQNNNETGGVSTGSEPKKGGCYHLALSALLTLVGSVLTIVGLSLQQRRYSYHSTSSVFPINYDLFFYQEKTSIRFGASQTGPLSDCLKAPYTAAMAMAVIGAAIALLVGIPLTYCASKYKSSPLRFVRPLVVLAGGIFALIAAIISAATTTCDGYGFGNRFGLSTGFHLLIAGACAILAASFLNLLQAAACPDPAAPVNQHAIAQQQAIAGGQSPQMAFASSNAAPQQQQQQQGGAPVYNFASQQQQQPVMGQPAPYNYGGGPGVHQNAPVMGQPQPYGGGLYGGGGGGANNNGGGGIYGNY